MLYNIVKKDRMTVSVLAIIAEKRIGVIMKLPRCGHDQRARM